MPYVKPQCDLIATAALLMILLAPSAMMARSPDHIVMGAEFEGGARERFGENKFGARVNYVYAAPHGSLATMQCLIPAIATGPTEPLYLHVKGRDDEEKADCDIRIVLGETVIYEGPSEFSSTEWDHKKFRLPAGISKEDTTCTIANIESTGSVGQPPWFMLMACAIGPEDVDLKPPIEQEFRVDLPTEKQPFPHPLPGGAKPGFAWRGTKGWLWKPEQYLLTIPHLPKCGMNFLMNCYGSMCDIENVAWGDPNCNRWYEPLPPEKKKAYEGVVKAAQDAGLTFCFSMNPNLTSSRFVRPDNAEDMEALWHHYSWMQGLGVRWFNISLDDIKQGIDPVAQCRVVNEILRRLRANDPEAQMIFCPTYYWGDGTDDKARPYLEVVAKELDPDVYLFWTGDGVVGEITRKAAETYKNITRHPLFLWDNYPVNDGHQTMHLAPVMHRDADLNAVIDGYMANPLHTQTEANLIPTYTCGDYAWNPSQYEPARSIGQAILHLSETPEQSDALKLLVERYPGMLVYKVSNTGFNAAREQYNRLVSTPHSRYLGEACLKDLEELYNRLVTAFPDRHDATKRTIRNDIRWMQRDLRDRYGKTE